MMLTHAYSTPHSRVHLKHDAPLRPNREFVLYWMTSARRTQSNFSLDRAVELALIHRRPLVVVEPLYVDEPHASARFHRFVLDGMLANMLFCRDAGVEYVPVVERRSGEAAPVFRELAARACVVVTDLFPTRESHVRQMTEVAGVDVRVESVDGNGIVPLAAIPRTFPTAHSFRRFLQTELRTHLRRFPQLHPLTLLADRPVRSTRTALRYSTHTLDELCSPLERTLAIDQSIRPTQLKGGWLAAETAVQTFLEQHLATYASPPRDISTPSSSNLSAYLHFGHLGSHDLVRTVLTEADWGPTKLSHSTRGSRSGWWGLSENHEAFLDQVITWRELGFNFCHRRLDDYDDFSSLPEWAQRTLTEHAQDSRPVVYERRTLRNATTHDAVWNAAQRQLVEEGRIHRYLRMIWGKRILEWSETPRAALETMIELNNAYALDGRDPNSYSGIFWTLGRFDRPWGPERPIFGKIRYMSSTRTMQKMDLRSYLSRWQSESREPTATPSSENPRLLLACGSGPSMPTP